MSGLRPPEFNSRKLTLSLTDDLAIVDVWAGSDQIVIGIQDLAPSQAMEMGQIIPEVSR